MAASSPLEQLRERFLRPSSSQSSGPILPLAWPELERVLPDGGFPQGVIELAAPHSLGGGTMLALAAVRAAQAKDPRTWCAWIDPEGTLYAPGVAMAGVELHRLFLVRPPLKDVGRVAVRVARSSAFSVIVIDTDPREENAMKASRKDRARDVLVRKLALLAMEGGASILLLTDSRVAHSAPLPVALRLELQQAEGALSVKVGKERFGRGGLSNTVSLEARPVLHLVG